MLWCYICTMFIVMEGRERILLDPERGVRLLERTGQAKATEGVRETD